MSGTITTDPVAGGTFTSAGGVFDTSAVNQLANAAQLGTTGNGTKSLSIGALTTSGTITNSSGTTVGGTLAALNAQTAITSVSTIQAFNATTITVPAGAMNVAGKTLRAWGYFVWSNGATTPTLTVTLKLGTVTMSAPVSAAVANSNSSSPAYFEFYVTTATTGTTGTMEAHGKLWIDVTDATAGNPLVLYPDFQTTVTSAVNLTAAQNVTVNLTVANGPVTTATLRQLIVEIIN